MKGYFLSPSDSWNIPTQEQITWISRQGYTTHWTCYRSEASLRQAVLVITVLDTLANKIRNDKKNGIKIDNTEIKMSLLVDDITLLLSVKHYQYINEVLSMCKSENQCCENT